jgi:hypothetical protein
MEYRPLLRISPYCIRALLVQFLLALSAQAADATDDRIVYTPLGNSRTRPECRRRYTLVIYPTGKVVYEGKNCVCEIGERELSIPGAIARKWINDLASAGLLEMTKNPLSPQDVALHELQFYKGGRSSTLVFSYYSHKFPRPISDAVREFHQIIRPVDRWVRNSDGELCPANNGDRK